MIERMAMATLGVALAGAGFGCVWKDYGRLPERIPTHFGFTLQPDRWGSRRMIWLLPFAGVALDAIFAVIMAGAASPRQVLLLGTLNAEVLAMFLYIEYGTVRVAFGEAGKLSGAMWFWVAAITATGLLAGPLLSK